VGYDRLLSAGLRRPEPEARRRAIKRWVVYALAWQLLVFAGVALYVALVRGQHLGPAWVVPPLAALIGTALPYQLAAVRLARAGLTG
jgi:hypothetical protein